MSSQRQHIDGLKDLEKMLVEHLPKTAGKAVLRRVGKKSLVPFVKKAAANAPVRSGDLQDSIKVTTRLSKRQAARQRKASAGNKAAVQIYAGAEALPHAHLQEFGSANNAPQPFMRPAWDAEKAGVLNYIKDELFDEIVKTIARRRKRLERKG